jgi:hypothetical protein
MQNEPNYIHSCHCDQRSDAAISIKQLAEFAPENGTRPTPHERSLPAVCVAGLKMQNEPNPQPHMNLNPDIAKDYEPTKHRRLLQNTSDENQQSQRQTIGGTPGINNH